LEAAVRVVLSLVKRIERFLMVINSKIEPDVKSRWWPLYRTIINTGTVVLMALLILSPFCLYPFLMQLAVNLKSPYCYLIYALWWLWLIGGAIGAGLVEYVRKERGVE